MQRAPVLTRGAYASAHVDRTASPASTIAFCDYTPEGIALLGISALHGVGFHTMVRLRGREGVNRILKAESLDAFERAIAEAGGKIPATAIPANWADLKRLIWERGSEAVQNLTDAGVRLCFLGDPAFPHSLANLPEKYRPLWIFYRGDLDVLRRRCVTVVGTRNQTDEGEFLARYAVSCARHFDAPVVSGLAHGIDRIVHEWCLRIGLPTVSVMGTGMLTTYPAKHAGLGDEIVKSGGVLISEYFPQQGPSAENFVWRNRLQAALGRVVIPAEWAKKSGTAHTVRFARKFKRQVFSLSASGVTRSADAGDGDRLFELPDAHVSFMEAVASAIDETDDPARQPPQLDLFGSPR